MSDDLRNLAQELRLQGRRAVEKARELDPERVEEATRRVEVARESGWAKRRELRERGGALAARWLAGPTGAATARRLQTLSESLAALPGLSALSDTVAERHGIPALVARVADAPADALRLVQLGEALQRAGSEGRAVIAARAVVSPTSLVTRGALRLAGGRTGELSATESVMRSAWVLTVSALRADPADRSALHAAARIYLAGRMPAQGLEAARRATTRTDGPALVTLARAYLATGDRAAAATVADLAVAAGCSLGWQVHADLVHDTPEGDANSRYDRFTALRRRVLPADLAEYHGVHRTSGEIAREVGRLQSDKAKRAAQTVRARLT